MANEDKVFLRNRKSDLRNLVLLMNRQNKRSWPPLDPVLKMLDLVIEPEELHLLLKMGADLYTYEQAAALSGLSSEKFQVIFESLKQKAFIGIKNPETPAEQYALHPFVVGWFEGQVSYLIGKPQEKEFARRYMHFLDSLRNYNIFPLRNIMNMIGKYANISNQSVGMVRESKNIKGKSTIVVDEKIIAPDSRIYPTNSINDLIMEYGTKNIIGQFKACMCRQIKANVGDPCRFKMPEDIGCMGFGERIKTYMKFGYMRQISKEEAFDIIQKARDCGAVHTVFHERDDTNLPQIGLCNCCWDCCGIFRTYNTGATSMRYRCYYETKIRDDAQCTGCGKCEKYCPTSAIKVVDKKVELDTRKCIGCGQCVHQCVRSVFEFVENKRTAFLPMLKKSEARITT
jgi:ferredoxin